MTATTITPQMTMGEILKRIPSAQRALFQRYHVGGCSSCGFQPTDTLEQVCKDHNLLDVKEVVAHLERAAEVDAKMAVEPRQVRAWLDAGERFRFIDVRQPDEIRRAAIRDAEPLDYANSEQYMELPKDTKTGWRPLPRSCCATGHRSSTPAT